MTDRQEELLRLIRNYTRINGYPPTLIELAQRLGTQHSAVQRRLKLLREAGRVTWVDGQARTIRVVEK